ncbi:zinc finger associated protein [Popillia japonica]|uniref:Zinc finger associated protein n=1 Tax=Popillia japonica TaxID=7064 RepID=A0AAW1K315_POPJA
MALQYAATPLPNYPLDGDDSRSSATSRSPDQQDKEDTLTPHCTDLSGGVNDLSDDAILNYIKELQQILEKRRQNKKTNRSLYNELSSVEDRTHSKLSPLDMDTSFCSTSSLVRPACPSSARKRGGRSSLSHSLDTSFCSTSSLVRPACPSSARKRGGRSSLSHSPPPKRVKVVAQVYSPTEGRERAPGGHLRPPARSVKPVSGNELDKIEIDITRKPTQAARSQQTRESSPIPDRSPRPHTSSPTSSQFLTVLRGHIRLPRLRVKLLNNHSEILHPLSQLTKFLPLSFGIKPIGAESRRRSDARAITSSRPRTPLRDKTNWCRISAEIRRKGYNFVKAQNTSDGIRIFPATEADFRGMLSGVSHLKSLRKR